MCAQRVLEQGSGAHATRRVSCAVGGGNAKRRFLRGASSQAAMMRAKLSVGPGGGMRRDSLRFAGPGADGARDAPRRVSALPLF